MSYFVGHKETRRYLHDTAISLKKGDFNTLPVFLLFKKKTAAEIKLFQTAAFDL